jgi:hypothetical protein
MDGLGSFLTQAWEVITSNTFLAAAGVIATIVVGGLGIWFGRARESRHKTDPSIPASGMMDDIKVRVEGKFNDAIDLEKVFSTTSYENRASPVASEFESWLKNYRANPSSVAPPASLPTRQAFQYWWTHEQQNSYVVQDFMWFTIVGAILEKRGHHVGPPLSPEEFAKMVNVKIERSKGEDDALRNMMKDR